MDEVLEIIYEVQIPGDLWLLWVDLQQSKLYVTNDLVLWSGLSGWCGSHVPHSQNYPCPHDDICSEYQCLVHGGRIPLQGLSCASVVSSHSVCLVCVNVGLLRVS